MFEVENLTGFRFPRFSFALMFVKDFDDSSAAVKVRMLILFIETRGNCLGSKLIGGTIFRNGCLFIFRNTRTLFGGSGGIYLPSPTLSSRG